MKARTMKDEWDRALHLKKILFIGVKLDNSKKNDILLKFVLKSVSFVE